MVFVSSAEIAKEIFKTHEASFSNRPGNVAIRYLTYDASDLGFAPYGTYWKFMKKLCMSELLNGKMLDQLFPIRQEEINRLDLQGMGKKLKEVRDRYDNMIENIIQEHEEARNKSTRKDAARDVLDALLSIYEDPNSEVKITRDNIKAFLVDMFTGGTDTTAVTLEWSLAELMNHPIVMEKARKEIDSVIGKDRIVLESDIAHLPYLQAIVKETLRLHPPSPFILRESTKNCTIAGYHIPAKTQIFTNVWAISRDPKNWDNPLEFMPERFLINDENGRNSQLEVRGQHYQLLPFGSGRRRCPGTSLALNVAHTTLAAMIQCFEWKSEDGRNGSVDMKEGPSFILSRAQPLICVPKTRLMPFADCCS
ncbi:Cytochrome P450 [Sesbania bispinosa]|nr:Cytochrome P450 [Sesbania bispinosa]